MYAILTFLIEWIGCEVSTNSVVGCSSLSDPSDSSSVSSLPASSAAPHCPAGSEQPPPAAVLVIALESWTMQRLTALELFSGVSSSSRSSRDPRERTRT